MAMRPENDAFQQGLADRLGLAQALGQRGGFCRGEVSKIDSSADVERGGARVLDQIRRRGNAQQTEGEPLEVRVIDTAVVTLPDGREELIRAERQAAHKVDLINE